MKQKLPYWDLHSSLVFPWARVYPWFPHLNDIPVRSTFYQLSLKIPLEMTWWEQCAPGWLPFTPQEGRRSLLPKLSFKIDISYPCRSCRHSLQSSLLAFLDRRSMRSSFHSVVSWMDMRQCQVTSLWALSSYAQQFFLSSAIINYFIPRLLAGILKSIWGHVLYIPIFQNRQSSCFNIWDFTESCENPG